MSHVSAWIEENRRFLEAELARLRGLVERRVRWQRRSAPAASPEAFSWQVIHDEQVDGWLADGAPEAEATFLREDPGARAAATRVEAASARIEAHRRACRELGAPPELDALAELFSLDATERDLLLLALAPELDPRFARLYAYLHDDAGRRWATPYLAELLLGWGEEARLTARKNLLPGGTLRRFELVVWEEQPDEPFPLRRMRVDERVVNLLVGVRAPDPRVHDLLTPVEGAAYVPAVHLESLARAEQWLRSGEDDTPAPLVQLVSPGQQGEAAFAAELARRLGLRALRLDARALAASGPGAPALLRVVEREAVLAWAALLVDLGALERASTGWLVASLERSASLVIVTHREPWPLRPGALTLRLAPTGPGDRQGAWDRALEGQPRPADLDLAGVVQHFALGPEAIARAASLAGSLARARGGSLERQDVWSACREVAGAELGELGQIIDTRHGWQDIVLPAALVDQLHQIATQVAGRARVHDTWGFGARLGRGRGITALFAGPSGAGKTMAAEVLAHELGIDLVRIDLSGVVSKYIGETEKNLRRVFDAAEQSGAILFFDEADALFGKRSEVKDSHDRYANIEVNYLLQRMEEYGGLAVLATNRKSTLDRAFLRRLRFVLDFPLPDAASRQQIWERVFPGAAPVTGLDFRLLSRLELSGGNIKVVSLNAAFAAAGQGEAIETRHVLAAARQEFTKLERPFPESDFSPTERQASPGSRAARH